MDHPFRCNTMFRRRARGPSPLCVASAPWSASLTLGVEVPRRRQAAAYWLEEGRPMERFGFVEPLNPIGVALVLVEPS